MPSQFRPLARSEGLLSEELDDELLVYDEQRHLACRLNRTAALVWRHADGARSVADLVEVLRSKIELADEDLVLVALDQLVEHELIESGYPARDHDEARMSRRRFIRRVGVVGAAALALPVVESVVAPTAAAAASVTAPGAEACYCPCAFGNCYCHACYCDGPGTGPNSGCETCYCNTCGPCNCDVCRTCDYCGGTCLASPGARRRW